MFPSNNHIRVISKYETSHATPNKTMNKRLLLFIIGLIFIVDVNAKKIDGIIVFKNDSIAHVTFNIPFYPLFGLWFEGIQKKIKYYNSTNKLIILKPDQAKEIRFPYKDEEIRMVSCLDCLFLNLIIDGRLRLLYMYDRGNAGNAGDAREGNNSQIILQKGGGELFYPYPDREGFKKEMKEYLSDCPEVVKKIDNEYYINGDYERSFEWHLADIVNEYNNCK